MNETRALPDGVEKYAESPLFSAETVPASLQRAHRTKDGTYGRLKVIEGAVSYYLTDQDAPLATIRAGSDFVILPTEEHFVRVSDDVRFLVEFCR